MDLFDFESIVQSVSQKIQIRNHEPEDVKQELYIKLLEVMPTFEKLPSQDAIKLCKRVLKNYAIDLYRKEHGYRIKRDLVSITDLEASIMCEVDAILGVYEAECEEIFAMKEMKGLVLKWASKQTDDVKTFLNELVNPSDQIKEKYLQNTKSFNCEFISPHHLRKIMGMSAGKWRRIQDQLQRYLTAHGYSIRETTTGFAT